MSRTVALLSVASLFLVGVLAGVLGTHLYHGHGHGFDPERDAPGRFGGPGPMPRMGPGHGPVGGPGHRSGRGPDGLIERLGRELELTPEQKTRITEIIEASHREAQALHEELLPRVHAQMDRRRAQIREVLSEEQRRLFDDLDRNHRGRVERMFLGR